MGHGCGCRPFRRAGGERRTSLSRPRAARTAAAETGKKKLAGANEMAAKALIAWSSGKDSAWAFHEARQSGDYEIVAALITVPETLGRVSMHGVREELLRAQLEAIGISPNIVPIPF